MTGLDTLLLPRLRLRGPASRSRASQRDIRDVEAADLRGFDAVVHLAALSNDPLGDLDPELTYEINLARHVRLAGPQARPESAASSSPRPAACTAPPATTLSTETRRSSRLRPMPSRRCAPRRALAELADDDFSPVFLRNATAYGVSPRLRLDVVLNNLVGWAFTTGKIRILSDGSPGARSSTSRTSRAPPLALLSAPREVVHDAAVQRRRQTRELPGARACRDRPRDGARRDVEFARRRPIPTRAATASTSASSRARCPSFDARVDGPRAAPRSSSTPIARPVSPSRSSKASGSPA